MAATTITRESMTDNVTAWNVTRIGSAIYDKIDALIGANITFGGTLSAEGFGSHVISSGGTGTQRLQVRNTTSGTTMRASLDVGNNSTAELCRVIALSSAHTASGYLQASGGILEANGAGGLSIACTDASGVMRFYTGASVTERMRIDASGLIGMGVTPSGAILHTGGSYSGSGTLSGVKNTISLTSSAGSNLYGLYNGPTLVEASSGTHAILAGALFDAPTITAGAGSVTLAANVHINGAPSASGAANYALYVASGQCAFPDGTASAPTLTSSSLASTGVYWTTSGTQFNIATNGVQCVRFGGTSVAEKYVELPAAANGTGAVGGQYVFIGRNSSGSGAPGTIILHNRSGSPRSLWVDTTDDLRVNSSTPTESGGDTGGVVVGDQTSTRATKHQIVSFSDYDGALALIASTPLYGFRYRQGGDADTDHVGILAEESPRFTRRRGTAFDPINAFGYTAGAIKALLARVESLEAALARAGDRQ